MSRFTLAKPALILAAGIAIGAAGNALVATAQQPNMQAALGSLQTARGELIAARPNKGGHREAAISLVDQAIYQTQLGISYAGD
jgi:hypothetical protein